MVINKDISNAAPFSAVITSFNVTGSAQRWQLNSGGVITPLSNLAPTNGVLSDTVPFQSITLYVISSVPSFSLQVNSNNAPGQLNLQLNGQSGLTYVLQSSTDLIHWAAFQHQQTHQQFASVLGVHGGRQREVLSRHVAIAMIFVAGCGIS